MDPPLRARTRLRPGLERANNGTPHAAASIRGASHWAGSVSPTEGFHSDGSPFLARVRDIPVRRRFGHSDALVQHRRRPRGGPAAAPAPRHPRADHRRRSRAAVRLGADRAGAVDRDRHRDPGGRARGLRRLPHHSPVPRPLVREGTRHPGPHLRQVRGREPGGQPQGEFGGGPGVLQLARRRHPTDDGNRCGTVGFGPVLRVREVRYRSRGVAGPRLLRLEALPPFPHRDLRRHSSSQPVRSDGGRSRRPRRTSGHSRLARHRGVGGRGGRGEGRRRPLHPRQRAQSRGAAPDRHRPRGRGTAAGRGRGPGRCGLRLRRWRFEPRRPVVPVPARGHPRAGDDARRGRRALGVPVDHPR